MLVGVKVIATYLRSKTIKITVIGTGYVGLVSGICFSDFGHEVTCVDRMQSKIDALNMGEVPIYEPGLDLIMTKNVDAGRLRFSTNLDKAVKQSDIVFIAVGTPSREDDGLADLSFVNAASREVALAAENKSKLVVIKSTVPVGTNAKVQKLMENANPNTVFDVISNPEFLREGSAIEDFMRPDRVIIGLSKTSMARSVMEEIYKPLFLREYPIMFTERESAEMIKYSSNAFLAVKISFINEIASLCENTGADIKNVAKGMGLDGRIGNKFLHAGPGFGGSCFPKDTLALCQMGNEVGALQLITEAAISVNDKVKIRMIEKVVTLCGGDVKNKNISVYGITFKPNTDDMRDAPSLKIIPELQSRGAKITVVDPEGEKNGRKLLRDIRWLSDPYVAAEESECILLLTEWNEFRALDLSKIAASMATSRMADFRNVYSEKEALEAGFIGYDSVGRKHSKSD